MAVDLVRTLFDTRQQITSLVDDDTHTVANTGLFMISDVCDIADVDANGNIVSYLATGLTISALVPNVSLVFSATVDTSAATGTPYVFNRTLDDGQVAMTRLYKKVVQPQDYPFRVAATVSASLEDTPTSGQMQLSISEPGEFFKAGDGYQLVSDSGLLAEGSVISQVGVEVVIDDSLDISAETGVYLVHTTLTLAEAIDRIRETVSFAFKEHDFIGVGDGYSAYYSSLEFIDTSESFFLDGRRLRRGTAGTRAALTTGAGNAALTLTALPLGLDGNSVQFRKVDPGTPSAALSIVVTGTYPAFLVTANLATDGASAITSTAAQVAAAINAHVTAKRILQAQFGGTGADAVVAVAATPLAGGLNNGTGDYVTVEIAADNLITGTGYKIIALHIRPLERNRLSIIPRDSEDLDMSYRY